MRSPVWQNYFVKIERYTQTGDFSKHFQCYLGARENMSAPLLSHSPNKRCNFRNNHCECSTCHRKSLSDLLIASSPFPPLASHFFFFLLFSPVSLDGCNSGVQVIWRGEPYVWKYGVHQVWLWAWVGFLFLTPIPIATTGWSKCYYSFFCFLELISFHHKSLQFYCSISRGLAT